MDRRKHFLRLLGLSFAAFAVSAASADSILDQTNVGPLGALYALDNPGTNPEVGQFFTAGATGTLNSISLGLYPGSSGANSEATVFIRDQTGLVLGETTIDTSNLPLQPSPLSISDNPIDISVSLQQLGINVSAGNVYSVGVLPDVGGSFVLSATANTYSGGTPYVSYDGGSQFPFFGDSYDIDFQTYVAVPGSILNLPGGTLHQPTLILGNGSVNSPIDGVSSDVGGTQTDDFYQFHWVGGSIEVAGLVDLVCCDGAYLTSSYTFELLKADGTEISQATLDFNDGFGADLSNQPNAISVNPALPPGDYLVGIVSNDSTDPTATIYFDTPLSAATPEPASGMLMLILLVGVAPVAVRRRWRA
jgi:hypothetical protein